MKRIRWQEDDIPVYGHGMEGGAIRKHFDLTALHGEREYLRHAFLRDVDGDGRPEIITRTMNGNRARCIRSDDGSTVWESPDVAPPPEQSVQISDIAVGDLDEDGVDEVLLASYQGDIVCLDSITGSLKWHRRIPWLINNSMLAVRKITPGPGKNIALTVAHEAKEAGPGPRFRYNYMYHPSLLVLDHQGDTSFLVEDYAPHNSDGHYTWTFDIDGDGFCEIACCGVAELVWFDHDGRRLFSLPAPGEDGHPDDVQCFNWRPDVPGNEIIYLDGVEGVKVASCTGEILHEATYPPEIASHLQLIMPMHTPDGPALVAANIRSPESMLLFLDSELKPVWGLESDADIMNPCKADWDGDGREEIITGTIGRDVHNKRGSTSCSFQVIRTDGSPICKHHWEGYTQCQPVAVGDIDGDGRPEVVVSVGDHDGPEGRWSLPEGSREHLFLMGAP